MTRMTGPSGLIPEQVWDGPPLPSRGLEPGKPTGSAMPLVWAHSEYLKLLRSAADGAVFDRIPIVEERYARKQHPPSGIEVFKVKRRPIRTMQAGKSLRITAGERFLVKWTADAWKTSQTLDSTQLGLAGSYADLPTKAGQTGSLIFTLFWPEEQRWEGKNYEVELE